MTTQKILEELKASGNDATKKIFLKHGAKEPFYGVSVENLKKIQKKILHHRAGQLLAAL